MWNFLKKCDLSWENISEAQFSHEFYKTNTTFPPLFSLNSQQFFKILQTHTQTLCMVFIADFILIPNFFLFNEFNCCKFAFQSPSKNTSNFPKMTTLFMRNSHWTFFFTWIIMFFLWQKHSQTIWNAISEENQHWLRRHFFFPKPRNHFFKMPKTKWIEFYSFFPHPTYWKNGLRVSHPILHGAIRPCVPAFVSIVFRDLVRKLHRSDSNQCCPAPNK